MSETHAQINRRGIEGLNRRVQLCSERFLRVQPAGASDQSLSEIRVNSQISSSVGVGEGAVRDGGSKTHVIKLVTTRTQTDFEIGEALAISDLGKRHREKLIPTGELTDLVISLGAVDAAPKPPGVDPAHQLSKS